MQANGVLFTFQPVTVESPLVFDQVKIRVNTNTQSRWVVPSLIIQARVPKVGIAVFNFGVPKGAVTGEVIWGTVTPAWPPRNGTDRVQIIQSIRTVVRAFLMSFPEVGLDPGVANAAEDLGTYYEVTGSVQPRPPRSTRSPKKGKAPVKVRDRDQGIRAADLDLLRLF